MPFNWAICSISWSSRPRGLDKNKSYIPAWSSFFSRLNRIRGPAAARPTRTMTPRPTRRTMETNRGKFFLISRTKSLFNGFMSNLPFYLFNILWIFLNFHPPDLGIVDFNQTVGYGGQGRVVGNDNHRGLFSATSFLEEL